MITCGQCCRQILENYPTLNTESLQAVFAFAAECLKLSSICDFSPKLQKNQPSYYSTYFKLQNCNLRDGLRCSIENKFVNALFLSFVCLLIDKTKVS
jgi:hypothetical protein